MIYVEFEAATSLTDAAWWARCDDCSWTSGPHPGENADDDPGKRAAERSADEHGTAMGEMVQPEVR